MESCWVEDIRTFEALCEEWDQALYASAEDNPFLLSDFIRTWWKYFHHDKKLLIFFVRRNDQLAAGIPLYLTRDRLARRVMYIGDQAANLTHFFSVAEDLNFVERLLSALREKGEWDIFELTRVLSNHPLLRQLHDADLNSSARFGCAICENGSDALLDLSGGYQNVMADVNPRIRRKLRQSKEKLKRIGGVQLERIKGAAQVRDLFGEYRILSVATFKMRGSISSFEDKRLGNFFEELFVTFDSKGLLDAHKLTTGSQTLAISFGYRFKLGFKWILTTFNPAYGDLRPGHLLIDALIQDAIRNGDPYFDMYYGGDKFYKQQWCKRFHPLNRVLVFRNTIKTRMLISVENAIRSNSRLFSIARRFRRRLGSR